VAATFIFSPPGIARRLACFAGVTFCHFLFIGAIEDQLPPTDLHQIFRIGTHTGMHDQSDLGNRFLARITSTIHVLTAIFSCKPELASCLVGSLLPPVSEGFCCRQLAQNTKGNIVKSNQIKFIRHN